MVCNYWADSHLSMLPIYQELIVVGVRIWAFSGDTDAVVPVIACPNFITKRLVLKLKLQRIETSGYRVCMSAILMVFKMGVKLKLLTVT
ncbi:serine carboxypeptidase-like 27, partial [Olea europaea subsp. europaea]